MPIPYLGTQQLGKKTFGKVAKSRSELANVNNVTFAVLWRNADLSLAEDGLALVFIS